VRAKAETLGRGSPPPPSMQVKLPSGSDHTVCHQPTASVRITTQPFSEAIKSRKKENLIATTLEHANHNTTCSLLLGIEKHSFMHILCKETIVGWVS
jgi:hypothetical protein